MGKKRINPRIDSEIVSTRLPYSVVKALQSKVEDGQYLSVSDAVRSILSKSLESSADGQNA